MAATPRTRQMARECLGARVRVVARLVTRIYEDALRPFDVRITQSSILTVLANYGPVTPTLLGDILELEKSTVSRELQGIYAKGWAAATPHAAGRGQDVAITAAGAALLERLHPAWQQAQRDAAKALGPVGAAAIAEVVNVRWDALRAARG